MNRIVIANWKMHKKASETTEYIRELSSFLKEKNGVQVVIAPAYPLIPAAVEAAKGTFIQIAAQNMHEAESGAFTGEVSASMLKEAGVLYVLLGHSERRRLFHETDALIHQKVQRAVAHGLTPVVCVGETEQERRQGLTKEVLSKQLDLILHEAPFPLILAYEPVWAIGTGVAATPEQAEEVHQQCFQIVANQWGKDRASTIPIIYGGSVTETTAPALFKQSTIRGLLVGGASLQVASFRAIIEGGYE